MSVINPSLVEVRDEGTTQGRAIALNFVGAGVSATVTGFVATVSIAGGGTGSVSATRVNVALLFPARRSQAVTIVDATVSPTSKINIWVSGISDSDVNSSMESSLVVKAIAGTGSFLLVIESDLPIGGSMSFDYMVLA